MVKMKLVVAVLLLGICGSDAEARGRRMTRQPAYVPYYTPATVPTQATTTQATTTQPAPVQAAQVQASVPAEVPVAPADTIVQASAIAPSNATPVVQANVTPIFQANVTPPGTVVPTPGTAAAWSAQWKAEQSARTGSVAHLGGGFGGGSFEGNGFGATPDQAIQNSCYWGQRTPIEIGVARGANGYYATIFYR